MTKRLHGRQYELAHIYAPKAEGEYILSKRDELREGKAYEVWQALRKDDRMARNYDEQLRYQYLRDIFFSLSTETPIYVVRTAGTVMHLPTNELGRTVYGLDHKETECIELSLRVHLQAEQVPMVQECLDVVEQKMTSFATDFYLHDMKRMGRELGRHPLLWAGQWARATRSWRCWTRRAMPHGLKRSTLPMPRATICARTTHGWAVRCAVPSDRTTCCSITTVRPCTRCAATASRLFTATISSECAKWCARVWNNFKQHELCTNLRT